MVAWHWWKFPILHFRYPQIQYISIFFVRWGLHGRSQTINQNWAFSTLGVRKQICKHWNIFIFLHYFYKSMAKKSVHCHEYKNSQNCTLAYLIWDPTALKWHKLLYHGLGICIMFLWQPDFCYGEYQHIWIENSNYANLWFQWYMTYPIFLSNYHPM